MALLFLPIWVFHFIEKFIGNVPQWIEKYVKCQKCKAALVLCWESLFDTEEKAQGFTIIIFPIIMIMIIIMIAYDETF